jgi:hypothetical protein
VHSDSAQQILPGKSVTGRSHTALSTACGMDVGNRQGQSASVPIRAQHQSTLQALTRSQLGSCGGSALSSFFFLPLPPFFLGGMALLMLRLMRSSQHGGSSFQYSSSRIALAGRQRSGERVTWPTILRTLPLSRLAVRCLLWCRKLRGQAFLYDKLRAIPPALARRRARTRPETLCRVSSLTLLSCLPERSCGLVKGNGEEGWASRGTSCAC